MDDGDRRLRGVTVDLACPQCGTLFTVAALLVLDGGTAWCPGCHALARGDEQPGRRLERLRQEYLVTLRRTLDRDRDLGGGIDSSVTLGA